MSPARFFFFDLPLILRVVYLRNKQTNSVTNIEFYKHVQYCFCCYVIKSAEATNKVLLSVVWNPLLIEINLSQIRTLEIKCEKVCAGCPYLSFYNSDNLLIAFLIHSLMWCLDELKWRVSLKIILQKKKHRISVGLLIVFIYLYK